MPTKKTGNREITRWTEISEYVERQLPHLSSVLMGSSSFIELRLKARDDGTVLAIIKQYGGDGGPIVAFGVGYDVILSLMSIDSTLQGGHWRKDKPWEKS